MWREKQDVKCVWLKEREVSMELYRKKERERWEGSFAMEEAVNSYGLFVWIWHTGHNMTTQVGQKAEKECILMVHTVKYNVL